MLTRKQIEEDIYSIDHDDMFSVYAAVNLKNTEIAFKFQFAADYEEEIRENAEILTDFLMNFSKKETKFSWWIDINNIEKFCMFADRTIVIIHKFKSYDSSFLLELL